MVFFRPALAMNRRQRGNKMIFFHFTSVNIENVLAVGLKAMPVEDCLQKVIGKVEKCVWLTTDRDLPQGFSSSEIRIRLVISKSDKRLVHWTPLRKRGSSDLTEKLNAGVAGHLSPFYLYFGDIPPRLFRSIEGDAARLESFSSRLIQRDEERS
jgi:hypothetical protein